MKPIRRLVPAVTLFLALPAFAVLQDASAPEATAPGAAAAPATMLRLRDGTIQWGSIQSHDPEGIVFERLDTGGRVRLPWTFLHPEEERELRTRFGYVDLSGEEILVEADHIVTVEGAEIVGIIVDRSGDFLLVKTASSTLQVPKNRLSGVPAVVQVPASEVYTRAELYAQGLANHDTSTAEGQFEIARWCERILDYAHAVEHYKKAAALDASFRMDDVRASLERATLKAQRQDQVDYIQEVDALVGRRRYDDAIARAQAFKERFPDSPLQAEAKRSYDRAVKARDKCCGPRGDRWRRGVTAISRVEKCISTYRTGSSTDALEARCGSRFATGCSGTLSRSSVGWRPWRWTTSWSGNWSSPMEARSSIRWRPWSITQAAATRVR